MMSTELSPRFFPLKLHCIMLELKNNNNELIIGFVRSNAKYETKISRSWLNFNQCLKEIVP